jgi:sodium-dependent dicarboxylate transporter 2/3/5
VPLPTSTPTRRRGRALAAAVIAAVALPFLPGVRDWEAPARVTAAVALLTAICWMTEALPLRVASLLPAILLPAFGAVGAREIAPWYFDDILLLFLGGFVLAIALERYGLHERLAWRAVALFGARPRQRVIGLMIATAGLSMFVNNTSTTLVMLPVAMALLARCTTTEQAGLGAPLMLGVAYAATIGGLATKIGTAPNMVFFAQSELRFPDAPMPGFGAWMLAMLPLAAAMLLATWWVLTCVVGRTGNAPSAGLDACAREARTLPPLDRDARVVLGVSVTVALLWITRSPADLGTLRVPGWSELLPPAAAAAISDTTVALLGCVVLFALPARRRGGAPLLDWNDCRDLPWGVLLLIGGGLALAQAFDRSGLSIHVAQGLAGALDALPTWAMLLVIAASVTLLSELASNTAAINLLLPLLFGAALETGLHPMLVALPAVVSVSYAFMLPVGTPPNAIVFATGRIPIRVMLRAGLLLDLIAVALVSLFTVFWVAPRLGFDLAVLPEWAAPTPTAP